MEGSFGVRKGAWTEEEDVLLRQCIHKYGEGKWHQVPHRAGLNRCRKSCRLRWVNYLKPNIKKGEFTEDEIDLILRLHKLLGNRWSLIAGRLPGRKANDVKNYWNTHCKKVINHPSPKVATLRQKNVITLLKDTEENAQNMVKVNVIKPQPRTLSKKFALLSRKPTIAETSQPKDNLCKPSPTENTINWWDSFFDGSQGNGDERGTCTVGGLEGETITNLLTDEIAAETQLGETFVGEDPGCWSDFLFDMDLWDLSNA